MCVPVSMALALSPIEFLVVYWAQNTMINYLMVFTHCKGLVNVGFSE